MTAPDGTTGTHSRRGWIASALLLVACAVYASAFWGRSGSLLPEPFDGWGGFYGRFLAPWVREHGFGPLEPIQQQLVAWVVTNYAVGMVLPGYLVLLCGRGLRDVGLGAPNLLGRRWIPASVLAAVPFGGWLLGVASAEPAAPLVTFRSLCGLLSMIPEHFLVFGVCLAVLLPDRRLPDPIPLPPVEGSPLQRALRWLGLGQAGVPGHARALVWLGLTRASLFAILAAGFLFWLIHVGKPNAREVASSLISGTAMAYVTLRSHSIWPALLGHWAMNLVPRGLLVLFA